jgi:hypothetical protein
MSNRATIMIVIMNTRADKFKISWRGQPGDIAPYCTTLVPSLSQLS